MNSTAPRETALKSYLHFFTYAVPSFGFVLFSNLVLHPRLEVIWLQAGAGAAKAHWIIDVCRGVFDNFYYIIGALTLLLILLENSWPRWQQLRSPVLRCLTWILTFAVMAAITWVGVAACVAVPMTLENLGSPR